MLGLLLREPSVFCPPGLSVQPSEAASEACVFQASPVFTLGRFGRMPSRAPRRLPPENNEPTLSPAACAQAPDGNAPSGPPASKMLASRPGQQTPPEPTRDL